MKSLLNHIYWLKLIVYTVYMVISGICVLSSFFLERLNSNKQQQLLFSVFVSWPLCSPVVCTAAATKPGFVLLLLRSQPHRGMWQQPLPSPPPRANQGPDLLDMFAQAAIFIYLTPQCSWVIDVLEYQGAKTKQKEIFIHDISLTLGVHYIN